MNKSHLIAQLAERYPYLKRADVEALFEAILLEMGSALANREGIQLRGFGVFGVKQLEARTRLNPKTGQKVLLPKGLKVFFKPGKDLKDKLNAVDV